MALFDATFGRARRGARLGPHQVMESVAAEMARTKAEFDLKAADASRRYRLAVEEYRRTQSLVKHATKGYYSDDSTESIVLLCGYNAVAVGVAAACAQTLRWCINDKSLARRLCAPRLAIDQPDGDECSKPPELEENVLTWPCTVWGLSDEKLLDCCGLDAFVLCRLALLGLKFCLCCLPVGGLLIVVYGWDDPYGTKFRSAARMSMCNVPQESSLLWAPVAVAYFVVLTASGLFWHEQKVFEEFRDMYMIGLCERQHKLRKTFRTVCVDDLPRRLRSEKELEAELEALFGDGCVEELSISGTGFRGPLARASGPEVSSRSSSGPASQQSTCRMLLRRCCLNARIVACGLLAPFARVWQCAKRAVREESEAANGAVAVHDESEAAGCHVVFKKHTTHAMALQMALPDRLLLSTAPYDSDKVEANKGNSRRYTEVRTAVVDFLLLAGLLLWHMPVTAIQALASWHTLQPYVPIRVPEGGQMHSMLTHYAPVYAWLALLKVLPVAFRWVAEQYEGVKSYSEIQLRTMRRYWRYSLVTLYVTVLSGSVFDAVGQTVQQPKELVIFLGKSLPQVSVFFLALVLSKGMLTLPLKALRPLTTLLWLLRCLREGLHTVRDSIRAPEHCSDCYPVDYGELLPDLLLVFSLCLVYAPIAPLMLVAGAVFFSVAVLTFRFGAVYVWRQPFQSQGSFFRFFMVNAVSLLPVAVLTLVATLVLQRGFAQAAALLPLLAAALAFGRGTLAGLSAQARVPLELARKLDGLEKKASAST